MTKALEIPMLKTLDVAEAPALLATYIANPCLEAVILTVKGKPFAIVIPTKGGDVETISLSFSPAFNALLVKSRVEHEKYGGFSSEEIRREFGLPPYQAEKPKRKPRKKTANRKRRTGTDGRQV